MNPRHWKLSSAEPRPLFHAAHLALQKLLPHQLTPELVAAYLICCNRRDEAAKLLWDARALGQRARETTKLLVELLVQAGGLEQAAELVAQDRQLLTLDDLTALEGAGILPREPAAKSWSPIDL